jgi:outer membrane lipoprotein-sorting protein
MKRIFVSFFALLVSSHIVFGQTLTSDIVFRDLKKRYDSIKSFQGSITISISSKSYSGTIKYLKPSMLKINFAQGIDIISDSKSMWIYIKGDNTVIKQPILKAKGGKSIFASEFINPYDKYKSEYIVVLDKYNDKEYAFKMKNKPDVFSTFSEAQLVCLNNGLISSLVGKTFSGQDVKISIKYSSVNTDIDTREFFFTPPADAQVLVNLFD